MSKRSRSLDIENTRLTLQAERDAGKSQADRNKLGQFATPTALAQDVLRYGIDLLGKTEPVSFLDPAIGTGSFYSALLSIALKNKIKEAAGFEIDVHYGEPAASLWKESDLSYRIADFTRQTPDPRFNLLICNPPYVRHHHISADDKARLQAATAQACGIKIGGLAGLYCYFLGLSHAWMQEDGVAGWLIPSEFMDVNYGTAVKRYLLKRVTLLHIHRFDPNDVQFADALVSSAVIWFRNSPPPPGHTVRFTFGGSLANPRVTRLIPAATLEHEPKWSRFPVGDVRIATSSPTIGDFFKIKRGIATGDNGFFILPETAIADRHLPKSFFRPILPSPRYLTEDIVEADAGGEPVIAKKLFLLDIKAGEEEIKRKHPDLWRYLEEGKQSGLHDRYLCRHRSIWYAQEDRPAAPIVCTYMGRGDTKTARPFRFILNKSKATVANVYLAMYPTPALAAQLRRNPSLIERIWHALNEIEPSRLLGEGRVYGGGLHKLEPKELAKVSVPALTDLLAGTDRPAIQTELFEMPTKRRAARG